MKQKKMLALTLSQLKQLYRNELPEIVRIAEQSDGTESFKPVSYTHLDVYKRQRSTNSLTESVARGKSLERRLMQYAQS